MKQRHQYHSGICDTKHSIMSHHSSFCNPKVDDETKESILRGMSRHFHTKTLMAHDIDLLLHYHSWFYQIRYHRQRPCDSKQETSQDVRRFPMDQVRSGLHRQIRDEVREAFRS